jgi:hypothetical protein
MGVDLSDALNGTVAPGDTKFVSGLTGSDAPAVAAVDQDLTSSVSLEQHPTLLEPSGTLRGFTHKSRIDQSAKPMQQRCGIRRWLCVSRLLS